MSMQLLSSYVLLMVVCIFGCLVFASAGVCLPAFPSSAFFGNMVSETFRSEWLDHSLPKWYRQFATHFQNGVSMSCFPWCAAILQHSWLLGSEQAA